MDFINSNPQAHNQPTETMMISIVFRKKDPVLSHQPPPPSSKTLCFLALAKRLSFWIVHAIYVHPTQSARSALLRMHQTTCAISNV